MIYGNTLASVYDALNDGTDVAAWADFICEIAKRYSDIPIKKICELACGTGTMATELALRGFEVTASDISNEMLTEAEFKSRQAGANVRFFLADMRNFSLYSKADAMICLLDSMNYLAKPADFSDTLESVYDNLESGGIFIFDINSKYKFENIYADNAYVLENDGVLCAWQNFYNSKTKICDFYLSVFTECADGRYERTDEHQRERMYTLRSVKKMILNSGFELCGVFSDYNFSQADENVDERLHIVLKKNK